MSLQRLPAPSPPAVASSHDRLLAAAASLAATEGYRALTVERLLEGAGVSRATFYQYFSSAQDCFWSAYRLHADELLARLATSIGPESDPELALLDALLDFARREPELARLLLHEPLAATPRGLLERDSLIARIEQLPRVSSAARTLPMSLLLGALFRFIVIQLEAGDLSPSLAQDVRRWAASLRPGEDPRAQQARIASGRRPAAGPPARPARIRTGAPRERLIRATVACIQLTGVHRLTVADVAAAAGVSRRCFYNEFPNKDAACVAAFEHGFERVIGDCVPAFFGTGAWPDRIRAASLAFTGFFAREPAFAYLGFVECHALGRHFSPRAHETHLAFTLFLEDGYRESAERPPRSFSPLTACAVAELGYHASRGTPAIRMAQMHPEAVYVVLAPFLGHGTARTFAAGSSTDLRRRSTPARLYRSQTLEPSPP